MASLEAAKKNLEALGYSVQYFATGAEAAEYLNGKSDGCSVGFGGSMTLKEIGLDTLLATHNELHWHWTDGPEARKLAKDAQVYICSANGLAETGEIVNIDGMGNRVAAIVYGPQSVIVVAGMNKVVDTLEDAITRARTVAAPINKQRFPNAPTPCLVTGSCADCKAPGSICNQMLITRSTRPAGRIKFILVGEKLGF